MASTAEITDWRVTYGNPRKGTTVTLLVRAATAGTARKVAKAEARRLGIEGRIGTIRMGSGDDD